MAENNETGDIEVFVPGRLCIIGEHSDWAGEYRDINPSISCGELWPCEEFPYGSLFSFFFYVDQFDRYDDCVCN